MATDFGFRAYDVERCTDPFVFISYKSEDYEQVAVYARHLVENGINVWYDEGLHSGVDWESYLMSVIEKPHCKAVLLFLSAKVAQSTVIPLETTQARACKKPTVAVHLELGLDIEMLLSKAIKVYVEQRQSVRAYIGTKESVCAEVLAAARNAMTNTPSAVSHSSVETLWKSAQMFLMNFRRSGSREDFNRARGYFKQMTEQEPTDYRGWLNLAMCAFAFPAESYDGLLEQFREAAKYYSYVVSVGADNLASPEYTGVKSQQWAEVMKKLRNDFDRCTGENDFIQLRGQAEQFESCFGHTEPRLRGEYELLIAAIDGRVTKLKADVASEKLRREKAAATKAIVDQCRWGYAPDGGISLVKYIGKSSSYDIPATVNGRSVTSIGEGAFKGCTRLTSVTIPDSVTSIGGAFKNCTGLTSITIPNSVTSIGGGAFLNCTSLASITILGRVTSIGDLAFGGCTLLASITIPDSVTSIGRGAFKGCISLTSVTIPDSVTSIDDRAFEGCTSLTSITIPDSVTSIGSWAFKGCTSLTSVTIPDSVTSIGSWAFEGCTSLIAITILGEATTVPDEAFKGYLRVESITIPDTVTSIGNYAFENCCNLVSFTVPDSVTEIGNGAFETCRSLASITIPENVKSLGRNVFWNCDSLESITILNEDIEIYPDTFDNCCKNVTVYGPGGIFSRLGKTVRAMGIKYKKIKG